MDYDVIIIGAGLGGLVCGTLLARTGLRVAVFEKKATVGGCCTSFTRNDFTFDLSVQSIGGCREEGRVWRLLDDLGVSESLELIPLEPAREYHFPDMKILQYADLDTHVDYLSSLFPQEENGIKAVYGIYRSLSEEIDRFPYSLAWFDPSHFEEEFPFTYRYREETLQDVLDAHIKDPQLKVILGVRSSYALLPPSSFSVIAMASLEMSYLQGGVAVLKGKMEDLPLLLAKEFLRRGGTLHTRHEVKDIMVEEGKAMGVRLKSGETATAHIMVSNADATATFLSMIGDRFLPPGWLKRLKGMKPSFSYFIIYLGVEGHLDLSCSNNEVFPQYDLEKEYRFLEEGQIPPSPPYYLLAPSLVNPSHAPQGYSTVCLSYKAPYRLAGGWDSGAKETFGEQLIAQAEGLIPDLRSKIVLDVSASPLTIERMTGNRWGAAYGWAQIPRQAGIYRLNRVSPIEGLYLAGHWTAPGGGVAAAMASGQITADVIENRLKEEG
jgi:phytoene dehydrogenase-like protein